MASTEETEEEGSGSTLPSGPPIPTPTVTPERQVTLVSVLEVSAQLADLPVWRKAAPTSSVSVIRPLAQQAGTDCSLGRKRQRVKTERPCLDLQSPLKLHQD